MAKYNVPSCIAVANRTLFPLIYELKANGVLDYKGSISIV